MNIDARKEAFGDLFRRYRDVFGHAWARRREMEPAARTRHELQFLPAALSLQETPIHPSPRIAMWLIVAFAVIALAWSIFGRVEVVAVAQGKIIPNNRTKVVQPLETSVVQGLHVREGQEVRRGDLLIELDPTAAQADTKRLQTELRDARYAQRRASALLGALASDSAVPTLTPVDEVQDARREAVEQHMMEGELTEFRSKLDQLDAGIASREAERAAIWENVMKLAQTVPIIQQRSDDYRRLLEKNYVSRHDYLQLQQQRIEMERDLSAQKARMEEIDAVLKESRERRKAMIAEMRRVQLEKQYEAEQKTAALEQELLKAQQRGRLTRLEAPVDGVVQQLSAHTVGGVVKEAEPIMVIVPREDVLEVEALVLNKDIGFLQPGQDVTLKVETFSFVKYGTLPGELLHISNDAIQDEKLGLVYAARILLKETSILVGSNRVNLTPGMAVTAEVKTSDRRLIEFFLSPLMRYQDESLRER